MLIRNSAKAIIQRENRLLLTKNKDEDGYFYLFPGGGQEHGETLHKTLIRECIEETGYKVIVGDLVHIREYIGKNHEHQAFDRDIHQIEFYFTCLLQKEIDRLFDLSNPDQNQVGIEWIPIDQLPQYRIYPKKLVPIIMKTCNKNMIYLGDIN
ncbi:ADP-ribose pyrophosphatase YjhB, NUDIX family [Gracilibacillus ureilyticus]|uniref:ADP-ribose pyrophosphatase YjhB, NUDIX family n=1 Tax=Gracilibacillus ureilyticus TaxID=531814 RepID=A0A1H9VU43_9BACI|nr:ADP-ribose pyrophosphatase YjhB, NUDIX family [Gracilibacillus ureilyticus]